MNSEVLTGAVWRKSTFSNSNSNCVEVADLQGGSTAVRDSKNPDEGALVFTRAQWRSFVLDVRAGQFG